MQMTDQQITAMLANLVANLKNGNIKIPNRGGGSSGPEIAKKLYGLDLTLGNLVVSGTTTTVNTATMQVYDKNIEIGNVTTPSDTTANGGGLTLKGATDKTIIWDSANGNWTLNQDVNVPTGKAYKINNASVLNATTLGASVVASSLTSVGVLSALQVNGNSGIGTATFGTDATRSLAIAIGTAPSSSIAGQVEIYAADSSAGTDNATLAFRTEEAVVTEAWTQSDTLRVYINGVEYKLGLDAV